MPTKNEEQKLMVHLKIDDNKGYFLRKNEDETTAWVQIDQIGRNDLFDLLNRAIEENFEMDEFKEEKILNKAHQIIYKSLYEKFVDLLAKKTRFKDESENLYKAALEKYRTRE